MYIPYSHGVGYTLGARIWYSRFWHPINKAGFRDKEFDKNKKTVLFAGDSFTAGHGLKNINYRYSNIFEQQAQKFIPGIQEINIGVNGADTRLEYANIVKFIDSQKIKPDYIVLQYFGNDIEDVAIVNGMEFKGFTPYTELNPILRKFIRGSYLLNYIYWLFPHTDTKSYIDFLKKSYSDDNIFRKHLEDIKAINKYSQDHNIPLLLLIFPFMQDIKMSNELYINKLTTYLDSEKIQYINLCPAIDPVPLRERVVNSNDGHASMKVNRIIADILVNYLKNKMIKQ